MLGSSLLILGIGIKKLIPGIVAMLLQLVVSLLSSPISFLFFLIFAVILFIVEIPGLAGPGRTSVPPTSLTPEPSRPPQKKSPGYRISAIQGPLNGMSYELSAWKQTLTFGRENCDVLFPGDTPGVGRHHCRVFLRGGEPYLQDNQSSYGTFLLDPVRRLSPNEAVLLHNNTRFCLARKDIVFTITRIS